MKKILIFISILFFLYIAFEVKNNYYVIPDESIRFRVIANSNSTKDQYIKKRVKEALEKAFYEELKVSNTIDDSRNIIQNNMDNYKKTIKETLEKLNVDMDYEVSFGLNYFPEKEYKGVVYKEGEYESLVITLGNGEGENFWCVLFPPICTLEVEEDEDISYRFLIKDLFDKYILNK